MIIPARRSFQLLAVNSVAALLVSVVPMLLPLWQALLGVSGLLWLYDGLRVARPPKLRCERQLADSLPVGVTTQVQLITHNEAQRALEVQLYDHYPIDLQAQDLPLHFRLAVGERADSSYRIKPLQRGLKTFTTLQARVLSPLGLWWRDSKLPVRSSVKIYPDFAAISQYALLATDNHLSHLGIMKRRRRGEGQDFHQLRDYRAGDSLRQIDWKATSRMNKPIAREYQDERDQEILFLLDCSHRMLAKDDELSHFDHTLNAMLLVAHVALKKGDAVGLGTVAATPSRWLKPHKGQPALNQLLNALYDLHASPNAPDFSQAATELLVRQKKRALVIVLSNLRDEDTEDLLPALNLLRQRHLVLFASLREQALDQQLEESVDNIEDALQHAATYQYLAVRQQTLEKIRATGTLAMDVLPGELSSGLINSYLDIKRSAQL